MYCRNCGKEVETGAAFCGNCGAPIENAVQNGYYSYVPTPGMQASAAPYNTMSIVGFVLACVSLFLNFWGIMGIAATVISSVGISQCKNLGQRGRGLAIAGLVIGILSILWAALLLILVFSW